MRILKSFLFCFWACLYFQCSKTNPVEPQKTEASKNIVIATGDDSPYCVTIELIKNFIFLEHVFSSRLQLPTDVVIATWTTNGDIYVSEDLGTNFRIVHQNETEQWYRCFTTDSGRHFLWDRATARIWIFDQGWQNIKQIQNGNYPWHGTWSIGEANGVIMYAEYASEGDVLHVWRSVDDGDSWESVFNKKGREADAPEIRHFHTLQPDPFSPGDWYLSSGDNPQECRIWKSSDDGFTWREVTDPDPDGTDRQDIHRYTAIYFDESFLYWGTDDLLDGCARFVKAERTEPLSVHVAAKLDNLVRSLVATPYGLVLISERKEAHYGKMLDLTVHISANKQDAYELFRIPSQDKRRSNFTNSRASIAARGNIFFTFFEGPVLFRNSWGFLKWEIVPHFSKQEIELLVDEEPYDP
ncbi:hypothetical protein JXJ21_15015 [candidate division KSB1 bacterium]|nr:hypothetical protein [candidate division KSB1 bacterium]